jgi:RNA polymerase sigma factor (sigma-70 family)
MQVTSKHERGRNGAARALACRTGDDHPLDALPRSAQSSPNCPARALTRVDRVSRLFENHHEALYRYLVRLSGDADLAADVAQETFVRLFEQPADAVIERAWLFKVGTNLVVERARTASRRERLLGATGDRTMADPPRDPHDSVVANDRHRIVTAAIANLSEKERMAVLMREEGFGHREIAAAVGTTTGSVGTLLARALSRLARSIELDPEAL